MLSIGSFRVVGILHVVAAICFLLFGFRLQISIGVVSVAAFFIIISILFRFSRQDVFVGIYAFGINAFWGLFKYYSYYWSYGLFASPEEDDRTYVNFAQAFAEDFEITYSFYDFFTGTVYKLISIYSMDIQPIDLAAVSWIFGGLSAVFIYKILKHVFPNEFSENLYICGTYLFLFTFAIIHFNTFNLRDSMGLFSLLGVIFFCIKRKFILVLIFLVFSFGIRGGNGGLALLFVLFFIGRDFLKIGPFHIVAFFILFITLPYLVSPIHNYLGGRIFSEELREDTDSLETRKAWYAEAINQSSGDDTTLLLARLGPAGYPFRMVASMMAPVKIYPLVGYANEVRPIEQKNVKIYTPYHIYNWIHIILLIVCFPRVIFGFWKGLWSPDSLIRLSAFFFLITLFSIVVISMQERHRGLFLIWYPLFFLLSFRYNNQYKPLALLLKIPVVLLISFFAIRQFL